MTTLGCPECSSPIVYDLTCHTWGWTKDPETGEMKGGRSCMPCDSATEYTCTNGECRWSYIEGLNSMNPRSEMNTKKRPTWFKEKESDYYTQEGSIWIEDWWDTHPEDNDV